MNEKDDKENKKLKYTPKQEQELAKTINKRNRRLVNLFKVMDLPVRIIGDKNKPALIYDERIKLHAFVHNFELRFMDSDTGGNCIYTIKLLDIPQFDKKRVLECINNYPKTFVSKIVLNKMNPILPLYVTGYDRVNKDKMEIRYPVFATCSPKDFKLEVNKTSEELKKDGYDCGITDNNIVLKSVTMQLYLTGYNYLNREEGLGKYPVFAFYSPKVYFEKERAKEIVDELRNDGYDCSAVVCE